MMTQFVDDSTLRERLRTARETIEFVDDSGCTLGVFCPMLSPPYDASLVPVLSDVERRVRLAQPGKYSTAEVRRHLESL